MKQSSRAATVAAFGFFVLVIPLSLALAQGNPLVPCTGTACQLCSLAKLAQNIINFTILLAIPLAALLFAWAGALYITARGNTGQVEKAHGIFGKVAFGFILALSGWLVVNTILVTIANPSRFASGSFFSIQCIDPSLRPMNKNLSELLSNSLGGGGVGGGGGSCPSGSTSSGTGVCKDDASGAYSLASGYKCKDNSDFSSAKGSCVDRDDGSESSPIPISGGGGPPGVTYQSGIDKQVGDASGDLNGLISCIGGKTGIAVSSISDSLISSGQRTFTQCRSGGCAHSANSCHYGGRSCGDSSYAVDMVGDNQAIKDAANSCGASFVLDEGNHVHASVGSCGCDGNGD